MIGVNGDTFQYIKVTRHPRDVSEFICERIASVDWNAADPCSFQIGPATELKSQETVRTFRR
jgi:hypothetical protein